MGGVLPLRAASGSKARKPVTKVIKPQKIVCEKSK
jgi:hypothetical protein